MKLHLSLSTPLLCFAFLLGCGQESPIPAASGQSATASLGAPVVYQRPASVPANFRATPHGYFHPDCVVPVADGEVVGQNGIITRSDGSTRNVPRCGVPHYDRAGNAIQPDQDVDLKEAPGVAVPSPRAEKTDPTIYHDYVAFLFNESQTPTNYIEATWTVPPAPVIQTEQTVYLFPGLEPLATGDTIVQPVLGWNAEGAFGNSWTISSWNCCMYGNAYESYPVVVAPGDEIYGTALGTDCDGGACGIWTITTEDEKSKQSTKLVSTVAGEQLNFIIPAAEEVYSIDHCAQYPTSGSTVFHTSVHSAKGQELDLPWSGYAATGDSPACSASVGIGDGGYISVATEPTTLVPPLAPASCTSIPQGRGLFASTEILSCDGSHALYFNYLDGSLKLQHLQPDGGRLTTWETPASGPTSLAASVEAGSAFVQRDMDGSVLWSSGVRTKDATGSYMVVENSGDMIMYDEFNIERWHTNTAGK